ncbi:glycoside hydrolase family 95 protein [Novosphingobium taihuense]|uniref:Alpha-L-fucosidase 2 n=1 Tax=Novosphingobium taihuense TaxID=260085 RepID=A0A7W7EVC5_9SPHN|nr:glycoside hydrolase family 95 protein [Novosphingobium taihuense]MBB4614911.1 alpha-L-fucosidase 2 [Novosphingobium taihuense]TWH84648.1 alpha-L-fucosidase 2 [Novosphingobium taihuense]
MSLTRRQAIATGAAVASQGLVRLPAGATTPRRPRNDILWYRQPAKEWTEALPVGNGRLGAMVFGGTAIERIQLNEDTLWSGGPYDPLNPKANPEAVEEVRRLISERRFAEAEAMANDCLIARPVGQMSYQTFGDLFIEMDLKDEPEAYTRQLDLDTATSLTRFDISTGTITRKVLASPVDQVIAIRLSATKGANLRCVLRLETPQDATVVATSQSRSGEIRVEGRNRSDQGVPAALRLAGQLAVKASDGTVVVQGSDLVIEGATEATILVAIATSHSGDPVATVERQITGAVSRSWSDLCKRHIAEHRRLYRRASLDLGTASALPTDERIKANVDTDEPALAALYFAYARYLMICSSRPGTQPANLQGIWNESTKPPWGSKYTININTQMNYWLADPANLGECAEPLLRMVRELAVSGAKTARSIYGARGWVAHHNTDLWRASSPIDGAAWGMWPMGGAWLCNALWDRWDYGRDRAWLSAIYPLMRGAAEFFLDTLQPSPQGLVTSPSISPENRHPFGASVCAGPAMDRQILRDLFARTAAAAVVLGKDDDFAERLRKTRAALAPDRIGAAGQLQEWLEDWDEAAPEQDHRHVSHLYALYPSHQIDPDGTPDLARAARVSLNRRGDETTGWATAWRIALWARLRDGERAHKILRSLLSPTRTYPNMFDAHPPFQIDGNFGGSTAIVEMLMLSRNNSLHLLPALPRAWPNGSARGLVARGGLVVDLAWTAGHLAYARLQPMYDGTIEVRLGNVRRTLRLSAGRAMTLKGSTLATS